MVPSYQLTQVTLASLSTRNGTNVAGVDISDYTGLALVGVEVHNNTANANTAQFAIQTSSDNGNGWANENTNSAFSTITDSGVAAGALVEVRSLDLRKCNRYIRLAVTASGSPAVSCGASLFMVPIQG